MQIPHHARKSESEAPVLYSVPAREMSKDTKLSELVGGLLIDVGKFLRQQRALIREDLGESLYQPRLFLFSGGAVAIAIAVIWITIALTYLVNESGASRWQSFGVIGLCMGLLGFTLILSSKKSKMKGPFNEKREQDDLS